MSSQSAPQAPASALPPNGEETIFQPTIKQRAFLELLQQQRDPASIRDLCSHGVVSRATLYRWQQSAVFNRWLAQHALQHIFSHSTILLTTSFNAALNGSSRTAETLLKFLLNPKGLPALSAYLTSAVPGFAAAPAEEDAAAAAPAITPTATQDAQADAARKPAGEPDPSAHPDVHEQAPPAADAAPPSGPAELPAATGVISAAFRTLSRLRGGVAEADLAAITRARKFGEELEKLEKLAEREQARLAAEAERARAAAAAQAGPALPGPRISTPGWIPTPQLEFSFSEVTCLQRMRLEDFQTRIGQGIGVRTSRQLRDECRADLIAAAAGHVCRMPDVQPVVIPELGPETPLDAPTNFEADSVPAACHFPDPPGGPSCLDFLHAFRTGDLETAKRGLRAGLPIFLRSTNNLTPFSLAARNHQIEMLEFAYRAARSRDAALAFDVEPLRPDPLVARRNAAVRARRDAAPAEAPAPPRAAEPSPPADRKWWIRD